jgi:REP element-mobilizing transposase RayT
MDGPMPGLEAAAREAMTGETILLTEVQADVVAEQLKETAQHRGWTILAGAVMRNHVHVVVGVPGDPHPQKLLGDLKAWGTRRLNRDWGKRPNGTWWVEHWSRRKLPNEAAVAAAIAYVARQAGALRVWVAEGWANGVA